MAAKKTNVTVETATTAQWDVCVETYRRFAGDGHGKVVERTLAAIGAVSNKQNRSKLNNSVSSVRRRIEELLEKPDADPTLIASYKSVLESLKARSSDTAKVDSVIAKLLSNT